MSSHMNSWGWCYGYKVGVRVRVILDMDWLRIPSPLLSAVHESPPHTICVSGVSEHEDSLEIFQRSLFQCHH